MSVTRVKRGDVGHEFTDQLTANGEPFDLTGMTVTFLMRPVGVSATVVAEEAELTNAAEGRVAYTTVEDDLDLSGVYRQEWEAEDDDGNRFTFPSRDHNVVYVVPDLNEDTGS